MNNITVNIHRGTLIKHKSLSATEWSKLGYELDTVYDGFRLDDKQNICKVKLKLHQPLLHNPNKDKYILIWAYVHEGEPDFSCTQGCTTLTKHYSEVKNWQLLIVSEALKQLKEFTDNLIDRVFGDNE